MTSSTALRTDLSPAEYLEFERKAELRHEYVNGRVYAMAGGRYGHNKIATNLVSALTVAYRDRPCVALGSDQRVKSQVSGIYTYPDVSALCGRPQFEDAHQDTLLNPSLIVEVLSESTESYDRGASFAHYRTIPSVQEYVLISQTERRVERFVRQPDNKWLMEELVGEAVLHIDTGDVDVPLDALYDKVFDLPDDDAAADTADTDTADTDAADTDAADTDAADNDGRPTPSTHQRSHSPQPASHPRSRRGR